MLEAEPGQRFRRIVLRDTCVQDHMCDGESPGPQGAGAGEREGVDAGADGSSSYPPPTLQHHSAWDRPAIPLAM